VTGLAVTEPVLAVHRSRKLIADFRLHRPRSAAEAAAVKAEAGPGAVFMAGGIDIVNRMKFGAAIADLIHLGGVAGLDTIEETAGGLRLGSLVTHDRLATSPVVRSLLPDLAQTWHDVANIRIRCKGTVGGNIMAGDPAYDFALAALAANARLEFLGLDGRTRSVIAGTLGAASDEGLLTTITLPSGASCRLVFDRSLRPIVTLALGFDLDGDRIAGGRVAIGCAYAAPLVTALPLGPLMPHQLAAIAQRVAQATLSQLPEPVGDRHATAAYRRRMIAVLLRRNLSALG
jgi:aerobic carbon-monoxide dehydrogenase medium subunit